MGRGTRHLPPRSSLPWTHKHVNTSHLSPSHSQPQEFLHCPTRSVSTRVKRPKIECIGNTGDRQPAPNSNENSVFFWFLTAPYYVSTTT